MGKYKKLRSIKLIWIFCEGRKTERNYFQELIRLNRIDIVRIEISNKTDAVGLMNECVNHRNNNQSKIDDYFCIFDRDSNKNENLGKIISLAKRGRIQIIFSNPCFEYWILCHFERHQKEIELEELVKKLNKHLGNYKKNDNNLYTKTRGKIDDAIKNAKDVLQKHKKMGIHHINSKSNPSTSVYLLIQKLYSTKKF